MDRRRAAGALLALAACIACSAAAPTASNHTALDLYEGAPEGCYYNFQHYGEGDRIMTNEPCLNCTCHNRMLMCYLRVCPFTKAIGQDCTVEKRADQCCPIVTCPDVPVDLLTSTSTTSPAEYGATGIGKLDKYGCSISGKYFPEGSKVPPTPNKPCEHCYCIRNMTTCVMQECTLHVDGCTPIYHKDVCCPVRYSCDHPEDEMPLLDDMSTTVRPTPGFLLTTTTISPVTQMSQDCVHDDQIFADGALIKTEKACEHCYCMKGDIVCVVQECGAPMENEGKNCTSLPPREGQCCPDTYICEGDELSSDFPTESTTETILGKLTTLSPPRRAGVEGSGYRNEPDEAAYTEMPTMEPEVEGSGEEQETSKPLDTDEIIPVSEDGDQYIYVTTKAPTFEEHEQTTTEFNKNVIPDLEEKTVDPNMYLSTTNAPVREEIEKLTTSGITEEEILEPHKHVPTTSAPESYEKATTELGESHNTVPDVIPEEEIAKPHEYAPNTTSAPIREESGTISPIDGEEVEPTSAEKEQEVTISAHSEFSKPEQSTPSSSSYNEIEKETTTPAEASNVTPEVVTEKEFSEPDRDITETTTASVIGETESSSPPKGEEEKESSQPEQFAPSTTSSLVDEGEKFTTEPDHAQNTVAVAEEESTHPHLHIPSTTIGLPSVEDERTTVSNLEQNIVTDEVIKDDVLASHEHGPTTAHDLKEDEVTTVEPDRGLNTIPSDINEETSSESSLPGRTTVLVETKATESSITSDDMQTQEVDFKPTTISETATPLPESIITKGDQYTITTEPSFRKEDESSVSSEKPKEFEPTTIKSEFVDEGLIPTSEHDEKFSTGSDGPSTEEELTTSVPEYTKEIAETIGSKQTTTESIHITPVVTESLPGKVPEPTSERDGELSSSTDKSADVTSFVQENVENHEEASRIPGEGDCLLNGVTYRNNTVVPSTNNCHTGCRCASSIIKCDPIICSPPPDYMDNCQSIYDSPDSCCPTYVCDHPRETVPPQSDNQMSGTESPTPSPTIECRGDQCEISEPAKQSTESSEHCTSGSCLTEADHKPEIECGSEGCGDVSQKPDTSLPSVEQTEECTDGKCKPESCANGECQLPQTHGQVSPTKPCEGEHCEKTDEVISPPSPQLCTNEEDCKSIQIPVAQATPCEGESCNKIDCADGGCDSDVITTPQDTQLVPCKDENGCKPQDIPVQECTGDEPCRRKEISASDENMPTECEGSNCKHDTETTVAQEISLGTESPAPYETPAGEVTEKMVVTEEEKATELPESHITTLDDKKKTPEKDTQEKDTYTTEGQTIATITEADIQKEKPLIIEDVATKKPTVTVEEGTEIPAMIDEGDKEKPAVVGEGTEKPALIEREGTETPAVIEEGTDEPAMVDEEGKEKPAIVEDKNTERPTAVEEKGTEQPALVGDEGEEKPSIVETEDMKKPAAIDTEGTELPSIVGEEDTEQPAVIDEEAKDKPIVVDEEGIKKPAIAEEQDTIKPAISEKEVTDKPGIMEEGTEEPAVVEKEVTEIPAITEEGGTEKPLIDEQGKDKPAVVEEEGIEKPADVENGTEKPSMVAEEDKDKPAIIDEERTDKPALVDEEETEGPVEEINTQKPALIEMEGTDKPTMVDEDGEEKPVVSEEKATEKPDVTEETGNDIPVMVGEIDKEKPASGEAENTEKVTVIDEQDTEKTIVVDEEGEEKPAVIQGDGKEKPAIIDEEGAEKPVAEEDAKKKPTVVEQESTEKPAIVDETEPGITTEIDEEHKEKPTVAGEEGTTTPILVNEEKSSESPAITIEENTEEPAIIVDKDTEKPATLGEDDNEEFNFVKKEETMKPTVMEIEGTGLPTVVGEEDTEKPSLIDEEGKDKPTVSETEGTEEPSVVEEGTNKPTIAEVGEEGQDKPVEIDEESIKEEKDTRKPAITEEETTTKSAITEEKGADKPAITDEEGTEEPVIFEKESTVTPAVIERESTELPAIIGVEDTEKPAIIDEEATDKPIVVVEEGIKTPVIIEEEGTEKPAFTEKESTTKPNISETESTDKPVITEEEGTEEPAIDENEGTASPADVEERVTDKPALIDEESNVKPSVDEEDIVKPASAEKEGTKKPVEVEEEGTDKPTIIDEEIKEKPTLIELESTEEPQTHEEEGSGTELPDINATQAEKEMKLPEVQPTQSTVTELEKVTNIYESQTTPAKDDEHVYSTESNVAIDVNTLPQESMASETPEIKVTETKDSQVPVIIDHSRTPEITTESLKEQESSTKTPSSITISEEALTFVHEKEKETVNLSTVTEPYIEITSPKVDITDVREEGSTLGQDMTIDEAAFSTKVPELHETTELVEKTTEPGSISEQEEVFTDTSELESPTTKAPGLGPVFIEPQEGIEPGLPVTSKTEEESTTKVYEEENIKPVPESHVTEVTSVSPEQSETSGRDPEVPKTSDEDKLKPELPELHDSEKMATESPVDVVEEEIKTPHPEIYSPDKEETITETAGYSVTEPVRRFTEIEDPLVTGQETTGYPEESTENIMPSATEKIDESLEILTTSSEKPILTDMESSKPPEETSEYDKATVGLQEQSTQTPEAEKEKPDVFETPFTEIPISILTESQEASHGPEKDITGYIEKTTRIPDLSDQTTKDITPPEGDTKEQETGTEIPQHHVTASEEYSKATESYITEQHVTEPQESNTKSGEKEEIDTQTITTEVPKTSVKEGEAETKAPDVMYTDLQDLDEKEPSVTEIPKQSTELPAQSEGVQTETPGIQVTSEAPQSLVTEHQEAFGEEATVSSIQKEGSSHKPESLTTQFEEITKTPDLHVSEHEVIRTETPIHVTESIEVSTKEAETEITEPEDKITKLPQEEVTEKQDTATTLREIPEMPQEVITAKPEADTKLPEITTVKQIEEVMKSTEHTQTEFSETTPYLIELEEHTHKIGEDVTTVSPSEEELTEKLVEDISTSSPPAQDYTHKIEDHLTTVLPFDEKHTTEHQEPGQEPLGPEITTNTTDEGTETATKEAEEISRPGEEISPENVSEKISESTPIEDTTPVAVQNNYNKYSGDHKDYTTSAPTQITEENTVVTDSEKLPISESDTAIPTDKITSVTEKPLLPIIPHETTSPEDEFIFSTTKATTLRQEEEILTPVSDDKLAKPEEKPTEASEVSLSSTTTEIPKPGVSDMQPTDEIPAPEEEGHFPPSGPNGYGEPDYVEEDQAFGPGTCRYGGKVYVSAQQIPRDDPCDFCFCFRSDIICLQQSCPPPIHGCHEEPIQGFCCPRYECPVSMATTVNVTTTTTTTTTTLPPHFPTHSYKGAAQRRGCQIKGHSYKVGEVVRSSSGPCLHCTCGGDGQMKCDPKACTPEPMLRQMIAAAVSAKRRR